MPVQVDVLLDRAQSLTFLVGSLKKLDRLGELDSADIVSIDTNIGHHAQVAEVALGNSALLSHSVSGLASKSDNKVVLADVVHFKFIIFVVIHHLRQLHATFEVFLNNLAAAVED